MTYQVFARKYRPQTFDDLVGQSHVAQTLKNAVAQNRLAHAYLFVGPRGVGKTSTARILAKALNCVNGPTITPCGVCDNCKEIAAGNSLDVIEIDGASNNSVEDVRELRDNVRYAPAKGKYKIYLIDEVHMLSSAAFNALLKTLEEPPAHVKFIFATTEPQKVLPTILSRCQRFDLHRIATNLIADHLQFISGKEKIKLAPAAAHAIARGAEGGLRDAESMLDQLVAFCGENIAEEDVLTVFGFTSQQTMAHFTEKILGGATAEAVQLLHDESEAGKDMMRLMSDLISYLRDLLVFKVKPDALKEDADADLQESLATQSQMVETDRLLELIDQFAEAEGRMKWAPNKKLHFEVALIKAIQSLSQVTLNQVIDNLQALRDGREIQSPKEAAPPPKTAPVRKADPPATKVAAARPAAAEIKSAPRVAEKAAPASSSAEAPCSIDAGEVWSAVLAKISPRGFLRTLVDSLKVMGVEGRSFVLGYPPDQRSAIETLATTSNRRQLETLLKEISGQDWTLKLQPQEGLEIAKSNKGNENYQDDPLIQEALEMFKGQIKP
ncbi:MAG TPA: DNA polymerase III subunit gamma/tau [Chthoniobacterales bacterium]